MMWCLVRGKRAGFTLIEIMIVIAIIAILAGIVVPNIMQARAESQLAACMENLKTIGSAVEMFLVRNDVRKIFPGMANAYDYCDNTNDFSFLTDSGYLNDIPVCPRFSRADTYMLYHWGYGSLDVDSVGVVHDFTGVSVLCGHHLVGGRDLCPLWGEKNGVSCYDFGEA